MLLSELLQILDKAIDVYGNLNVLLEDYEIGNLMDLHSVKIVEVTGEKYVMLSDKIEKGLEIDYLN